uniref:PRKR-like endoplasmic reticulum kinase n=1 Tax=Acrobeloides nanus TaxID=290746 RepID=A0A914BVS1_9BILA
MRSIYVITATGVLLGIAAAYVSAYRQEDEDNAINEPVTQAPVTTQSWLGSFSSDEPRCCNVATLDLQEAHYLLVSTLSGEITAFNVNNYGNIEWKFSSDSHPLVDGSFKSVNAHVIPLLDGSLLVYPSSINGNFETEPVLLDGSFLLQSSFKLDNNEVVAGGISFTNTGLDPLTGQVKYHCSSFNCEKNEQASEGKSFHTLVLKKNAHQFRAADAVSGSERWNLSVSQYDISLVSTERHTSSRQIEGNGNSDSYVNFKIHQPDGRIRASDNCGQDLWSVELESPIAKVWELYKGQVSEISLFDANTIDDISTIAFSPYDKTSMAFFGMFKKNPYLLPSPVLREHLTELSFWANRERLKNLFTTPYYRQYEVTTPKITAGSHLEVEAENQNENPDPNQSQDTELDADLEQLKYYLGLLGKPKQGLIEDKSHLDNSNLMCKIKTYKNTYLWKLGSLFTVSLMAYLFYRRRIINREKKKNKPSSELKLYTRNTSHDSTGSLGNSEFSSKFLQEFELQKCLGRGGFGIVFECRNKIDECDYAVKRVAVSDDEAAIERVRREVKAMAKLDHPNVIRYYHTWLERPPPGWQHQADSQVLLDLSCNPSTADAILNGNKKKIRERKKISEKAQEESELEKFVKQIPEVAENVKFGLKSNGTVTDEGSWVEYQPNKEEINSTTSDSSDDGEELMVNGLKTPHLINGNSTSSIVFEEDSETPIEEQKPINPDQVVSRANYTPPVVLVASNNSDLVTSKTNRNYVYLYIQMQLCQQHTLSEWLTMHKSWKDRELQKMRGWFTQSLEAIEYVHRQGLIHRDLKPKNIFFDADGRLKIGDLGLATQYVKDFEKNNENPVGRLKNGSQRRSNHTSDVGTRSYMSPEQINGETYDFKVDVFSLGLIYCEMLIPFTTDMERIMSLQDIQQGRIEKLKDRLPIEYPYIEWLTQQDPKLRPTCKEVLQSNFLRNKVPSSYKQVLKTTLNKLPGVQYIQDRF